jgi:hypothetical protein
LIRTILRLWYNWLNAGKTIHLKIGKQVMPKSRPPARSKIAKPKPKTERPRKPSAPAPAPPKHTYSAEYAEYLERYELYGEGRPRLSPSEFDRLDEEMLELLELEGEKGILDDEQIVRLQELEYLMLDTEM